jgi:hypothetical protein
MKSGTSRSESGFDSFPCARELGRRLTTVLVRFTEEILAIYRAKWSLPKYACPGEALRNRLVSSGVSPQAGSSKRPKVHPPV